MDVMMPQRIQRKRTKGFKLPPGCVYVGRPGKWGNPFTMVPVINWHLGDYMDDRMAIWRKEAVWLYRLWLTNQLDEIYYTNENPYPVSRCTLDIQELRGKSLACWCRLDTVCHADILLELANAPPDV